MAAHSLTEAQRHSRTILAGLAGGKTLLLADGRFCEGSCLPEDVHVSVPADVSAVPGAIIAAVHLLDSQESNQSVSKLEMAEKELAEFALRAVQSGVTTIVVLFDVAHADLANALADPSKTSFSIDPILVPFANVILPLVASQADPSVFVNNHLNIAMHKNNQDNSYILKQYSKNPHEKDPKTTLVAPEPILSQQLLAAGALVAAAGSILDSSADMIGIVAAQHRSSVSALKPTHLDANALMRRITIDAANAFGLSNIGRIETGAAADLVLVKTRSASKHMDNMSSLLCRWSPLHDIVAVFKNGILVHASDEFDRLYKSARLYHYYSVENVPGSISDSVFDARNIESGTQNVFDSIEHAIDEFRRGNFLVVVDNEDRENEGDLIIAAEDFTPDKAAFMIRYTSGVICAPASEDVLDQLELPLMVTNNTDSLRTAYTISTDYKHGTTTGISAADRSATVRALASPSSSPSDFSRPGHVFPLRAVAGGVLRRVGHTEASIDLCRLASKRPVAAICEIVMDDGRMARRDNLCAFAKKFNLAIITIHDLVQYRVSRGL